MFCLSDIGTRAVQAAGAGACTVTVGSAFRAPDGSAPLRAKRVFVFRFGCSACRADGTSARLPQLRRSLKPARLEREEV